MYTSVLYINKELRERLHLSRYTVIVILYLYIYIYVYIYSAGHLHTSQRMTALVLCHSHSPSHRPHLHKHSTLSQSPTALMQVLTDSIIIMPFTVQLSAQMAEWYRAYISCHQDCKSGGLGSIPLCT